MAAAANIHPIDLIPTFICIPFVYAVHGKKRAGYTETSPCGANKIFTGLRSRFPRPAAAVNRCLFIA